MDTIVIQGRDGYELLIGESVGILAIIFEIRKRSGGCVTKYISYHRYLPSDTTAEKWLLELARDSRPKDAEGRSVALLPEFIDFDFTTIPRPSLSLRYYGITGSQVEAAILQALEPKQEPAPRLTIGGKTYELREVGDGQ